MILDQSRFSLSPDREFYLGEDCELAEIQSVSMTEMHNLTIAMARFEHQCLIESAGSEMLNEGVKEFVTEAINWIKTQWNRFWAWISAKFIALKDMFIKRKGWLDRNKTSLGALTDAQLSGLKAKLGGQIMKHDFAKDIDALIASSRELVTKASAEAEKLTAAADKGSLSDRVRAFFSSVGDKTVAKILDVHSGGSSIAKSTNDELVGAEAEVSVNAAIVKGCLKAAEDTYLAVEKLKGVKMVADGAIKEAEGLQRIAGAGDSKLVSQKISVLKECAPQVQALMAAYSAALSTANSQAMGVLVKAAGHKSDGKGGSPSPAGSPLLIGNGGSKGSPLLTGNGGGSLAPGGGSPLQLGHNGKDDNTIEGEARAVEDDEHVPKRGESDESGESDERGLVPRGNMGSLKANKDYVGDTGAAGRELERAHQRMQELDDEKRDKQRANRRARYAAKRAGMTKNESGSLLGQFMS